MMEGAKIHIKDIIYKVDKYHLSIGIFSKCHDTKKRVGILAQYRK